MVDFRGRVNYVENMAKDKIHHEVHEGLM